MNYSLFRISGLLLTFCLQISKGREYGDDQEVVLINQLNNYFHFDHNIFLLDSSIDRSDYIGALLNSKIGGGNYTPQSVYSFKLVNNSITGFESLKEIRSKNTFLIVVVGNSKFQQYIQLFYHVILIQRLNVRMKIGIFFSNIEFIEYLEELCHWYWKNRILNIFGAFYLNDNKLMNVYKFNPFGKFELINVTKSNIVGNYFPSQLSNFQQYPLRVPVIPLGMNDYDATLWESVLNTLNASFTTIEAQENLDGLQLFGYGELDIIPRLLAVSGMPDSHIPIYPMRIDEIVIVVPQAPHFSDFMAYLIRMTSDDLFGYFLITMVVVTLLLTVSRHLKTKKILFVQCAVDVLNILMNDNASIKYRQLYRADVCLIVPLTFTGFIIVNGILSIFQSYVTLPVNQPQINTIDDLYKSTVAILTPDNEWKNKVIHLLEQVSGHDGWNDKVVRRSLQEINEQIYVYDTSISFFTMRSGARILLEVQKRLNIGGYHAPTEIYLIKTYLSYSINGNCPFIERINDIIHSIRQAGLFYKWIDDHDEKLVKHLIKRHRYRYEESNGEVFPMPTVVLYGWLSSVIVFIGEVVWEKYNLSKIMGTLYSRIRI